MMLPPKLICDCVFEIAKQAGENGVTTAQIRRELSFTKDSVEVAMRHLVSHGDVERGEWVYEGNSRLRVYRALRETRTNAPPEKKRKPAIGEKFATLSEHIAAMQGDDDFEPQKEAKPTAYLPGSQEKIRLMRLRVDLGQALFADADVRYPYARCNLLEVRS